MARRRVAVITRTKDRPQFLDRAIHSVLRQSFEDWVHVIVNDGGDPAAVDLLVTCNEEAYEGRVVVVHNEAPTGMQNASNAGLAASDSEYVVIHDDDDSWYPDFLEKTVSFLEAEGPDSSVQGVVCQSTQVIEEINLRGEIIELSRNPYYPFEFVSLDELRKHNLFPPIAFLYRRRVHETIGFFRQEFDVLGDHDFNLRFLRHFDLGVLRTFNALYHWRHGSHANTVTGQRDHHRDMLNRMKNAYAREMRDDPQNAVGTLEHVQFPPPQKVPPAKSRLRKKESPPLAEMPDFEEWFDFEILSLDVFDTLLKRRCHHPRDVFQFLETRAVSDLGLPEKPYALARHKAEVRARERIRPEVTFEEIHGELAALLGLDSGQSAALLQLELAIEKEMLFADPRWLGLYHRYREQGIRILILSDMYFSAEVIRDFLTGCGFEDPEEIFVSNEWQATKHDGTLFKAVAEKLDLDPKTVLHIGDNYHSDYLHGWQSRWRAFHWGARFEYHPWYTEADLPVYNRNDPLSTRIMGEVHRLGLTRPLPEEELFTKLGREVAGPLYLAYMLWVIRTARESGIRRLVLLGRDGYFWEKTLRILEETGDLGIEYHYMHSSRKVLNFASFKELDDTAIDFLLTPNPSLRVRDFIDRTGLPGDAYLRHMQRVGFFDPDKVLTTELGGQFIDNISRRMLRNLFILLKDDLEALFAEDREGLLKALEEAGYHRSESALVDIGWRASCIPAIRRLFDIEEKDEPVGYFFATWEDAKASASKGTIKSFFAHMGNPRENSRLVRESVNWMESLHAAPFPTLLGFRHTEAGVEAQFSEELRGGYSIEEQERIWAGAEAFLRGICENGLPEAGAEGGHAYIHLVLHRLLREPSPIELKTWGRTLHSEGFGLEVYKPLVREVTEEASDDALMAAYQASNWKRGFMASVTEAQRRTVSRLLNRGRQPSYQQLKSDLKWQTAQTARYWAEAEKQKEAARWQREQTDKFWEEAQQLKTELQWQKEQTDRFWSEAEGLKADLQWQKEQTDTHWEQAEALRIEMEALKRNPSTRTFRGFFARLFGLN